MLLCIFFFFSFRSLKHDWLLLDINTQKKLFDKIRLDTKWSTVLLWGCSSIFCVFTYICTQESEQLSTVLKLYHQRLSVFPSISFSIATTATTTKKSVSNKNVLFEWNKSSVMIIYSTFFGHFEVTAREFTKMWNSTKRYAHKHILLFDWIIFILFRTQKFLTVNMSSGFFVVVVRNAIIGLMKVTWG